MCAEILLKEGNKVNDLGGGGNALTGFDYNPW